MNLLRTINYKYLSAFVENPEQPLYPLRDRIWQRVIPPRPVRIFCKEISFLACLLLACLLA
jgi:hypothetical protein